MRVVLYCRVSTARQVQEGLSLEGQEQEGRAWARRQRHRVVAVCRDAGVSGAADLENRDGLAEALDALSSGQADALWVEHLDRLARDLMVQESILRDVWAAGASVFVDGEGRELARDDPDDPSRKMTRQMLGAVSEYERALTALRLRRGRRRKAEGGGFAYGSPPFGMRSLKGELVPDQKEQATIRRARDLRARGLSLRAIATTLNENEMPPKRAGRQSGDKAKAPQWHATSVARMLGEAGSKPKWRVAAEQQRRQPDRGRRGGA